MQQRSILLIGFLLWSFSAVSQVYKVSGVVRDSLTRDPLAFVSVGIIGQQRGVLTDIDGKFSLQSDKPFEKILLNYVAYKQKTVRCYENKQLDIRLSQNKVVLSEVVIVAGENPANRIIRKTIERKDQNNPENLHSFTYESYNKFIYTVGDIKKQNKDTIDPAFERFIQQSNLFMMESVTERRYKQPEHSKEIVKATKVSGFQDPSFALMATEFQSFSFYTEILKINNKNYINPISKGTFGRYLFILKDTVFEGKDTVFVIAFQPHKNKNFDALKGLLYINTHGFALENVIAEPAEVQTYKGRSQINMGIKIQQKYERLGEVWFPIQLNADLSILSGVDSTRNMTILGISRSYIRNVVINPDIPNSAFDHITLDYDKDAGHKDSAFWAQYRVDTLNTKEKMTYVKIDSIGKKYHLDRKMNFLGYLIDGQIPMGYLSLDLNTLLGYNAFEGLRLGAGFHTNDKISKTFTVGAYGAYGFKDGLLKYGYDGTILLHKRRELKIKGLYYKDVVETGASHFYNNYGSFLSNEGLRNYFINRMDRMENKEISLGFRAVTYANVEFSFSDFQKISTSGYKYKVSETQSLGTFNFATAKVAIRYAYSERYMKNFNRLVPVETKYPVLWIQYSRGLKGIEQSAFIYNKWDAKVEHTFYIKGIGEPTIQLAGGIVDRQVPLTEMYAAQSSYGSLYEGLRILNTFQTMRMNEFYSQRFVSICTSHNFGKLLYKGKKFQPQLEWANNILFGDIESFNRHSGLSIQAPAKGYFETGLSVNNLFKAGFMGYGLGVFYRYGTYSYSNELKNLALVLTYMLAF